MRRNDIKKLLLDKISKKEISLKTTIHNLSSDLIMKLAEKLTPKGGVVQDWRILASYYGYDHTSIQQIGSQKGENAQFSPTKVLFQKIMAEKPNMKIGELVDILGDRMTRYDVVRKLESFYK